MAGGAIFCVYSVLFRSCADSHMVRSERHRSYLDHSISPFPHFPMSVAFDRFLLPFVASTGAPISRAHSQPKERKRAQARGRVRKHSATRDDPGEHWSSAPRVEAERFLYNVLTIASSVLATIVAIDHITQLLFSCCWTTPNWLVLEVRWVN